jgi:hypothetical protein
MLAASTDVASVVGKGVAEKQHPDKISADAYQAIWGKQNRGQRDFQVRNYTSLSINQFSVQLCSTSCHTRSHFQN